MSDMYSYGGSRAASQKDEPVYLSKWKTYWVLPPALKSKYGGELIMQQIKKIGGLDLDKNPGASIEQFYRFQKRRYIGSIVDTAVDLEMEFEVNVNKNGVMYPYNIFKDWNKLCFDQKTGIFSLKRDYCGALTIEIYDKIGNILRNVYFPIIFPISPLTAWDLEYNADNIYTLTNTFAAEDPTDITIGAL